MSKRIKGITIELDGETKGLDKALSDVNKKSRDLQGELRQVERALKFNPGNTELVAQKQQLLAKEVENTGEKLKRLKDAQADVDKQFASGKINEEQYRAFQREIIETESKLKHFEGQLATSQSKLKAFGDSAVEAGQKMKDAGAKITSAGKELSTKVTAPLVGVAAIAAKIGSDFEAGMSKVQAISGASGEEIAQLTDKAREMGATTQFSASEAADALSYMAMAGWKTGDMLSGIDGIMALAAASGEDLALTADILTDGLTAFGMTAADSGKFADVLAAASSNANTNVAMLGESFKYVAPLAGAMGYTAEDTALALGLMANAGIKSSQAGTSLKTMFANLAKPTKAMSKAMKDLGISLTDNQGNMKTMDTVLQDLRKAFGGLSETQQAQYSATIFGKEAMAGALSIINASEADYNKLSEAINNSDGAAKQMATTMTDNLQGRLKEMQSALEEAAISIYNNLQPALEKIVAFIQDLADWFNNLSPATQNTIIALAGVAAAIGPLLVIIGTLVASLGAIFTAIGTFSGAMAVITTGAAAATPAVGALAATITALTGPIGIAVAAITAVGVGVGVMANNLRKDAIPEIELFGEGVSEATKVAVGGFLELNKNADVALKELSWGSKAVSAEIAETLKTTFSDMGSQITSKMEEEHANQLSAMQDFYANSKFYGDESRDANLKAIEEKYAQQKAFIATGEETINSIISQALAENRELTDAEYSQINLIKEGWLTKGIQVLSENELETKSILERMKAEAETISAEQAAEVVKNSAVQRDGAVQSANEQYDASVQAIIKQRDELGTISGQQAQIMISDAKLQRDESVKHAKDMHEKVVDEAKSQAEEHVKHIDWETGEVLSKWEVFKNKNAELWDKISEKYSNVTETIKETVSKNFGFVKDTVEKVIKEIMNFVGPQLEKFKAFWDENGEAIMKLVKTYFNMIWEDIKMVMGLIQGVFQVVWPIISGVVKVAWELIKATVGTAIDLVLGIIQTTMKLIQGDWEGAWNTIKETVEKIWGNIKGFFQGVDLVQIGKDIIGGLIKGIGSMADSVVEKVKSLADSIPNWMKKVLGIKSPSRVMMEVGKWTGQGLADGIDSTKAANEKAVLGVAKVLSNAARKNSEEVSKIAEEAEKKRTEIQNEYAKKRADLNLKTSQSSQTALKTHKNKKGEIVRTGEQKVRKIRQDASVKLTKLNEEEQKKLTAVNNKAWADMVKKEGELSKERLAAVKTYVEDKKSLNELSLIAETEVWRKSLTLFQEGTKERVEIQKGYQAALKAVNDEVTKTNEEYVGKMQAINNTLRDEEKKLTDEYEKSVNDRASALTNFMGIFDAYEYKFEQTGLDLTKNLQSQISALEGWSHAIERLSERAIDKGLLDELRAMGPKALPQLVALNQMTDEELKNYSELYKKRSKLGREYAEKEMAPLKANTEKQINDLRAVANKELGLLQNDWTNKIKSITKTTDDELKSLKQIGVDAGQGLLDGLSSMEKSLVNTARSIANAVSAEMRKALQVKSPSRVTTEIGEFVGEGLMVGMENMLNDIKRVAARMGDFAVPSIPKVAMGSVAGGSGTMNGSNGSPGPVIHNYERMLDGAVFHVREESDIRKIARELYQMQTQATRGRF